MPASQSVSRVMNWLQLRRHRRATPTRMNASRAAVELQSRRSCNHGLTILYMYTPLLLPLLLLLLLRVLYIYNATRRGSALRDANYNYAPTRVRRV